MEQADDEQQDQAAEEAREPEAQQKEAAPEPAAPSQPETSQQETQPQSQQQADGISVDPTTDLPQGAVKRQRSVFGATRAPTDAEIEQIKPQLPYPDFDEWVLPGNRERSSFPTHLNHVRPA